MPGLSIIQKFFRIVQDPHLSFATCYVRKITIFLKTISSCRYCLRNLVGSSIKQLLFYPITLGGRWGTTDEFATIPFHLDLFSAALVELAKSIPVHSLILSSHRFFCLPLFLFPFNVPCRIVFAKPEDLETWPNHLSFRFLTRVRSSSFFACTFQLTIGGKFAPLIGLSDEDMDMDTMITTYNTAVTDAASEILGKERRRKKPWVTKDVLDLCDERRDLKKKRYEAEGAKEYREANRRIQKAVKKAKEE